MNEDWEDEEVLDIDGPNLPDALREIEIQFKNTARYVLSTLVMVNIFYMQKMENCWSLFGISFNFSSALPYNEL